MPILLTGGHFQSCKTTPRDGGSFLNEKGNEYHWHSSALPIPVNVDSTLPPHMIFDIRNAADHWNEVLDMTVFEVSEVPPNQYGILGFPEWGTISVSMGELGKGNKGMVLGKAEVTLHGGRWGDEGRIHSVNMWMDDDLDYHIIYEVALHELGHSLGLRHDGDPASIMFWTVRPHQFIMPEDVHRIRRSFL